VSPQSVQRWQSRQGGAQSPWIRLSPRPAGRRCVRWAKRPRGAPRTRCSTVLRIGSAHHSCGRNGRRFRHPGSRLPLAATGEPPGSPRAIRRLRRRPNPSPPRRTPTTVPDGPPRCDAMGPLGQNLPQLYSDSRRHRATTCPAHAQELFPEQGFRTDYTDPTSLLSRLHTQGTPCFPYASTDSWVELMVAPGGRSNSQRPAGSLILRHHVTDPGRSDAAPLRDRSRR
jgi:hypothetical protein